jgi:hypothetical protein
MATRKKTPPRPVPVSIEVNGKTYNGTYTVDGSIISVSFALGSKRTQIGGSSPESLARVMLCELIREGNA